MMCNHMVAQGQIALNYAKPLCMNRFDFAAGWIYCREESFRGFPYSASRISARFFRRNPSPISIMAKGSRAIIQ